MAFFFYISQAGEKEHCAEAATLGEGAEVGGEEEEGEIKKAEE